MIGDCPSYSQKWSHFLHRIETSQPFSSFCIISSNNCWSPAVNSLKVFPSRPEACSSCHLRSWSYFGIFYLTTLTALILHQANRYVYIVSQSHFIILVAYVRLTGQLHYRCIPRQTAAGVSAHYNQEKRKLCQRSRAPGQWHLPERCKAGANGGRKRGNVSGLLAPLRAVVHMNLVAWLSCPLF